MSELKWITITVPVEMTATTKEMGTTFLTGACPRFGAVVAEGQAALVRSEDVAQKILAAWCEPATDYAKRLAEIEAWADRMDADDGPSCETSGFGDLAEEVSVGAEHVRELLAQLRAASDALAAAGIPDDGLPLAERARALSEVAEEERARGNELFEERHAANDAMIAAGFPEDERTLAERVESLVSTVGAACDAIGQHTKGQPLPQRIADIGRMLRIAMSQAHDRGAERAHDAIATAYARRDADVLKRVVRTAIVTMGGKVPDDAGPETLASTLRDIVNDSEEAGRDFAETQRKMQAEIDRLTAENEATQAALRAAKVLAEDGALGPVAKDILDAATMLKRIALGSTVEHACADPAKCALCQVPTEEEAAAIYERLRIDVIERRWGVDPDAERRLDTRLRESAATVKKTAISKQPEGDAEPVDIEAIRARHEAAGGDGADTIHFIGGDWSDVHDDRGLLLREVYRLRGDYATLRRVTDRGDERNEEVTRLLREARAEVDRLRALVPRESPLEPWPEPTDEEIAAGHKLLRGMGSKDASIARLRAMGLDVADEHVKPTDTRPETGPMRFGDDWAGVFLRGDYAGPMAMYLRGLHDTQPVNASPFALAQIRGLADTLAACDHSGGLQGLQQMRPFGECMLGATDAWHEACGRCDALTDLLDQIDPKARADFAQAFAARETGVDGHTGAREERYEAAIVKVLLDRFGVARDPLTHARFNGSRARIVVLDKPVPAERRGAAGMREWLNTNPDLALADKPISVGNLARALCISEDDMRAIEAGTKTTDDAGWTEIQTALFSLGGGMKPEHIADPTSDPDFAKALDAAEDDDAADKPRHIVASVGDTAGIAALAGMDPPKELRETPLLLAHRRAEAKATPEQRHEARRRMSRSYSAPQSCVDYDGCQIDGDEVVWPDGERWPTRPQRGAAL